MTHIQTFIYNPFQENTYLISDPSGQCIVLDPGCHSEAEQQQLASYITDNQLQPQFIVLTHGHMDHVLGVHFLRQKFQIQAVMHPEDLDVFRGSQEFGRMVGLEIDQPADPEQTISDQDTLACGKTAFTVLHVPGHSPGSIALYHKADGVLFSGDVLFKSGVGRTDLMGGSFETLMQSIQNKLFALPDETTVYPGHGAPTTIGQEKRHNPVLP